MQLGEKGVYFIIQLWSVHHEWILGRNTEVGIEADTMRSPASWLLLETCSACFLTLPRTTRPGVITPRGCQVLPLLSLRNALSTDLPTNGVDIFSTEVPSSRMSPFMPGPKEPTRTLPCQPKYIAIKPHPPLVVYPQA